MENSFNHLKMTREIFLRNMHGEPTKHARGCEGMYNFALYECLYQPLII